MPSEIIREEEQAQQVQQQNAASGARDVETREHHAKASASVRASSLHFSTFIISNSPEPHIPFLHPHPHQNPQWPPSTSSPIHSTFLAISKANLPHLPSDAPQPLVSLLHPHPHQNPQCPLPHVLTSMSAKPASLHLLLIPFDVKCYHTDVERARAD
jgi:hypothetical protein